jgi:hypothetical protein
MENKKSWAIGMISFGEHATINRILGTFVFEALYDFRLETTLI